MNLGKIYSSLQNNVPYVKRNKLAATTVLELYVRKNRLRSQNSTARGIKKKFNDNTCLGCGLCRQHLPYDYHAADAPVSVDSTLRNTSSIRIVSSVARRLVSPSSQ